MAATDDTRPRVQHYTTQDNIGWVVALLVLLALIVFGLLLWWRAHVSVPNMGNGSALPENAVSAPGTSTGMSGNTDTSDSNTPGAQSQNGTGNTNAGSAGSNVVTPVPPAVSNP